MTKKAVVSIGRPNLRIIGGDWRSRRLWLPPGTEVRPTPNRVRETVFNWLEPRLAGARCLDLYAGSGALGFEALSRGAAEVVFVERDPRLVAALERNAALLRANARVVATTARSFLSGVQPARFDIVFVDPPYSVDLEPVLSPLSAMLSESALVYMERPAAQGLPALGDTLGDTPAGVSQTEQTEAFSWHRTARAASVCYGLASFETAR